MFFVRRSHTIVILDEKQQPVKSSVMDTWYEKGDGEESAVVMKYDNVNEVLWFIYPEERLLKTYTMGGKLICDKFDTGCLMNSSAIATNREGNGCLLSGGTKIVVVTNTGKFVRRIKIEPCDAESSLLVVNDEDEIFTVSVHHITMYNKDGEIIMNVSLKGVLSMNYVHSMDIDSEGIIYLLCSGNCIAKFDKQGVFIHKYSYAHYEKMCYTDCGGLIIDQGGNLLVSYEVSKRIDSPASVYVASFQLLPLKQVV